MTTTKEQTIRQNTIRKLAEQMNTDFESLPDYKRAQVEAMRFCWELRLESNARGGYTDETAEGWEHRAFSVLFSRNGRTVSFDWKQGMGITTKPQGFEVICAVCRDYLEASENSFDDWAGNFGYDSDSRKAEAIYGQCLAMGDKLKKLGLSRAEVQALADFASRF
jgi:hypothetical protein